ncbi:hypothetical protein B0A52_05849 [Exophiala mesophila]|uniref:Zn(2)-C6 fungal-type domain-containing protein n=1 Tax=Exophiala mesophila TaxID=212818 RepID=A0A438N3U9_EXOME|nr:hypothetical protein B0A52_05849 [Exophiala mesophila]
MSDFASLTHKFRANLDSAATTHKVNKRNRQPLSCVPCRAKKLKCDRGHPCETCVKKGDAAHCTYGRAAAPGPRHDLIDASSNNKIQERLRHLEELVLQMVEKTPEESIDGPSTASETSRESTVGSDDTGSGQNGHLEYGSSEARYMGSTHWSAILENIQEMKTSLGTESNSNNGLEESQDRDAEGSESLFGRVGSLSLDQIISQSLPPRDQVDGLLLFYFESGYLVQFYIHYPEFQRAYEEFWRDPSSADPLWVSQLFSICCMAATLREVVNSEPPPMDGQLRPRVLYENAACQCLRLGGFVKPKKYAVEAMLLYCWCRYLSTMDPLQEVGTLFAIIIRLAYRSGYHRDSSHFPHISVFEGEMRRRTWAACRQFDLMLSFQMGLPTYIAVDSCDTQSPRNLLESDLDRDTKELPPSRPETERTAGLYFVVKTRLVLAFAKSCAHALSFANRSRDEVMDLDANIRRTYDTVPEVLQVRSVKDSRGDPSSLIMSRLNCQFLFQKSLVVLHRKYMTQGNYPESTKACVEAATTIVNYMIELRQEFQPGGNLEGDGWMVTSFVLNDFHLATMVLFLSISMWKKANPHRHVSQDPETSARIQLVISAFEVCQEFAPICIEAKRVSEALAVALGRPIDREYLASGWRPSRLGYPAAKSRRIPASNDPDISPHGNPLFRPSGSELNLEPLSLTSQPQTQPTLNQTSNNTAPGPVPVPAPATSSMSMIPNHEANYGRIHQGNSRAAPLANNMLAMQTGNQYAPPPSAAPAAPPPPPLQHQQYEMIQNLSLPTFETFAGFNLDWPADGGNNNNINPGFMAPPDLNPTTHQQSDNNHIVDPNNNNWTSLGADMTWEYLDQWLTFAELDRGAAAHMSGNDDGYHQQHQQHQQQSTDHHDPNSMLVNANPSQKQNHGNGGFAAAAAAAAAPAAGSDWTTNPFAYPAFDRADPQLRQMGTQGRQ